MSLDLIVIGGGPAGCAASITAAGYGARVLLLERGRYPRHKVCGEFVSAESLDLLRQLLTGSRLPLISDAPPIPRSRIFVDHAELAAEISPAGVSITRFDLDCALWNSAIERGVEARALHPVDTVRGGGPFEVRSAGKSFTAKAVINCTGRWSNLTSPTVRATVSSERWIGIKSHFREASPPNSVDLYFFEGGYCGVQPVSADNGSGAVVNACAMVRADIATDLDGALHAHPALHLRSKHWTALMNAVTTSPLVFHDPELVHNGILQAGDSATFVDPFIGDGISLALRSGALAAECLALFFRGECSSQQATANYCNLYQRKLAPVFRASSRLRQVLHWPGAVRKPVLSLLQRTPAVTNMLVRMTR